MEIIAKIEKLKSTEHLEEAPSRLETIVYFIRHGEAEELAGGQYDLAIDEKRHLSLK